MNIDHTKVFSKRITPARFKALPETPFMTPTVIEDLKHRWNWENILDYAGDAIADSPSGQCIWAGITEVVPGEADIYCAESARHSGAAILTSDSDLLVHELGSHGSVVFFNSIELADLTYGSARIIRGMEISPTALACKLGVVSIQRLAYELKRDPSASFSSLVQHSKSTTGAVESSASYLSFMEEYHSLDLESLEDSYHSPSMHRLLDPKITELLLQYTKPKALLRNQLPHVYLPILIEHHDRQSAWLHGNDLRALAYSVLGLSVASDDKLPNAVVEYLRKGRRIYAQSITPYTKEEIVRRLAILNKTIENLRNVCEVVDMDFWRLFAICEILSQTDHENWPSVGHMARFLQQDYCAEKLEWSDVHLSAQIQAILYSLKILRETLLYATASLDDDLAKIAVGFGNIVTDFPPMWVFTKPRKALRDGNPIQTGNEYQLVNQIFNLATEKHDSADGDPAYDNSSEHGASKGNKNTASVTGEGWTESRSKKKRKKMDVIEGEKPNPRGNTNLYELLRRGIN